MFFINRDVFKGKLFRKMITGRIEVMSRRSLYMIQCAGVAGFAAIAGIMHSGCEFTGAAVSGLSPEEKINAMWETATLVEPYTSRVIPVYQDGPIEVKHGQDCARADRAYHKDNTGKERVGIRIDGAMAIPSAYDNATVFLNGWRLHYSDKDHEVTGFTTAIVDIEKHDDELRWKAGGVLSDKNGDDDFVWCYAYTVMMWKSSVLDLDARPVDSDEDFTLSNLFQNGDDGQRTAFRERDFVITNWGSVPRALLPRGFGVLWGSSWYFSDYNPLKDYDHHLMQFALKNNFHSVFENRWGGGGLTTRLQTVFKDNDTRRDYLAGVVVSTLNGTSVDVIQPPFDIWPREQGDCPNLGTSSAIVAETIVVEDVPFDYAVPMLTGWDIGDICEDHHIKDIGVWIESFDYEKDPDLDTGTLTYHIKSVFRDKGSSMGQEDPRYQVSILGLNRRGLVLDRPHAGQAQVQEGPMEDPGSGSPAPALSAPVSRGTAIRSLFR